MKNEYSNMTQEDFDTILIKLINESPASHLLNIPGVYEAIAEEYNNCVLDRWKMENSDDE